MFFDMSALSGSQWALLAGFIGLFVALSLYSIWDAFHRDFGSSNAKLGWIQLAVLVPFLGGLAYLLIGRKKGRRI